MATLKTVIVTEPADLREGLRACPTVPYQGAARAWITTRCLPRLTRVRLILVPPILPGLHGVKQW